jgi:hypothetical protein
MSRILDLCLLYLGIGTHKLLALRATVLYRSRQWASTKGPSVRLKSASWIGRALAVLEVGALSDLDNIAVRIADIAARLAVLRDRLRDELSSSTLP